MNLLMNWTVEPYSDQGYKITDDKGKVRGLICGHCNAMLGYALDNQNHLTQAVNYLAAQSL